MRRKILPVTSLAAGVGLVACFELSGPPSSITAISPIQFAWPAVVKGDALRDSEGDTARLLVEVFGGDAQPVTDADVTFIVLDRGLHVTPDGVVIGDSIRSSPARVVAQVRRGGDVLQTPEIRIDVVPLPDSVAPRPETTFTAKPIPVSDPAPIPLDTLTVKVLSRAAGTGVKSWIVEYEILHDPEGVDGQDTALFTVGGTARSVSDTTDASGVASRAITLQRALLPAGTVRDSVVVRATIRRIGAANETRTVTFTLPLGDQ